MPGRFAWSACLVLPPEKIMRYWGLKVPCVIPLRKLETCSSKIFACWATRASPVKDQIYIMKKVKRFSQNILFLVLTFLVGVYPVCAQSTAFTYQGRLNAAGAAASGNYDLAFALYNDPLLGILPGSVVTNSAVPVTNGLFTVTLDFGSTQLNGQALWLQILVRTNGSGAFSELTPRQPLTSVPYAMRSLTANSVAATNLSGTIPLAQLPAAVVTTNQTSVTLDNVTLGGYLNLPMPARVYSGGSQLLSADGNDNFYAGINAGIGVPLTGELNTGVGFYALFRNSSGLANTASGSYALFGNTSGKNNVAIGFESVLASTNDNGVVAVGYQALENDNAHNVGFTSDGNGQNTAVGYQALQQNTSGTADTAMGYQALNSNTTGFANTADGAGALFTNTTGAFNTACGFDALYARLNGDQNTADGAQALYSNSSGDGNIALGAFAGYNLTSGNNNIYIGNQGNSNENNNIYIGTPSIHANTFIAGNVVVGLSGSFGPGGSLRLNDRPVYLRGGADVNHGLAYCGTGVANFGSVSPDGPVLWGYSGGVLGVMNGGPTAVLTWTPGGVSVNGGFTYSSDRNLKTGFQPLNAREILDRVTGLPISSWIYKTDTGARHVGPMAQDFHAAFQVNGADDTHINIGDEAGVALAAIQGLNQKLEETRAENAELKQELAQIKQLLTKLSEKNR